MGLSVGTKLGPYEIVAAVGAGGMGEVYRAHDTRLGRDVAIKVLPEQFSTDADLKQRFEREARAISSLSHPHICQLYDVGSQEGTEFLVMEYLDGETLSDRLLRGPLPVPELLKIGSEVADALDKAHRQGTVHRDLKPGNIMLTKSGAKLMDFGLAKTVATAIGMGATSAGSPLTPSSPTTPIASLTRKASPLTQKGMIVGTFQYMAPEVLQGDEADARSDIFSFGCVLYEMATGKRAFEGKTQISVLAAILEKDPEPITTAQPMTPPALDMVIKSCLAKEPDERIQTAHDIKLQLQWIAGAGSKAGIPAPVVARRRISNRVAWGVALAAILAAIAFAIGFVSRAPAPSRILRTSILPPSQHSFDPLSLALSPDGTKLAFGATATGAAPQLWVRPLDSMSAQPLAGTEEAVYPFWSPDSHSLGFFAEGKLKIIDATGGAVQTLADAPEPRGGSWGQDGTILYTPTPTSPMMRIPATGGSPSQALDTAIKPENATGFLAERWPSFLPDGDHFIFFKFAPDTRKGARGDIHLGSLKSRKESIILQADYRGHYANGYVVFVREGNLLAQRLDEKTLKLAPNAVPIAEQVATQDPGSAGFSLSSEGKLVFAGGQSGSLDLAWYDRSGKKGDIIDTGTFQDSHISPDGKKVSAARVDAGGHLELYIYDLARGTKSQFSFSQTRDDDPIWSPDGNTIVFDSGRSGRIDLYSRPANGSRQEELLYHDDFDKYPSSWSSDGKYIAYEAFSNGHFQIWVMPMSGGDHKPYVFLDEKQSTRFAIFSPDVKWMSYTSYQGGHSQVYVVAFPNPGGKFLVGDGYASVWTRGGKEIIYLDNHSRMVSVEVATHGDSVELGKPQVLFPTQPVGPGIFDASSDGQKVLLMQAPPQNSTNLTLVTNWASVLKT